MSQRILILLVCLTVVVLSPACATKKSLKNQVTRIDTELSEMGSSVEESQTRLKEHDSQLASLSTESREALERAQSAEKLAQGKLLYEIKLADDSVKFPFNKAEVSPEMRDILDNLLTQLKTQNENVYIEIQGFTDSVGPTEYNYKLGLERAETVRRYLSENGIPLHRISTISYGEERPVADNTSKAGRSKNRRVVIQVLA